MFRIHEIPRAAQLRGNQRARNSSSLHCEVLEVRRLLTVSPVGGEIAVASGGSMDNPQVAMDAEGNFMVVWQDADGSNLGIWAWRYDSDGDPLGDSFLVNTFTTGSQSSPRVAMNASGQAVVTWRSADQDGSGTGIYAQVYDALGAPVGGELQVNTTTAGNQTDPSVGIDAEGDFAIAWSSPSISAGAGQRFSANGTPVGSEITITGQNATLAMNSQGEFITFARNTTVGLNTYELRRYDALGSLLGQPILTTLVNPSSSPQLKAALNERGEIVVALAGTSETVFGADIYAQRFNDAGIQQGPAALIATTTYLAEFSLALDIRGNSLFAWNEQSSPNSIRVRQLDSDGALAFETALNLTSVGSSFTDVGLALNDAGNIVASWLRPVSTQRQVTARQLSVGSLELTGLATGQNEDLLSTVAPVTEIDSIVAKFSGAVDTTGGAGGEQSATNPANWQLLRGETDISGQIAAISNDNGRVTLSLVAPLTPGSYRLVAKESIRDANGAGLDGDRDGTPGGDSVRTFSVGAIYPKGPQTPVGPAAPIVPGTPGKQLALAANQQGDFFAVRLEGVASPYALVAYRYNAEGVPLGSFVVDDNADRSNLADATKAVIDEAGNLIVAWPHLPYPDDGIYVRKFSPDGTPLTAATFVAETAPFQLALANDGTFAIAYYSNTDALRIHAQFFDAAGLPVGAPATLLESPRLPSSSAFGIAFASDGSLLLTWSERFTPDNTDGLYLQHFSAQGVPLGDRQLVRPDTDDEKEALPAIASLSGGGVVISWFYRSGLILNPPIYARLYDDAGAPRGPTFDVHSDNFTQFFQSTRQLPPTIAVDGQGHFLIATAREYAGSNKHEILARGFFDNGTPLGDSFRVNTVTNLDQFYPSAAADGQGNFFIGWQNPDIELQRLGLVEPPIVDLNGPALSIDYQTQWVPGDGAVSVGDPASLTVGNAGGNMLDALTVSIDASLAGDVLVADTSGTSITAAYVAGVLTLSGTDTLAHYEQVLRTVTFDSTASRTPGASIKTSAIATADGLNSPVARSTIGVYVAGSTSVVDRHVFYKGSSKFTGNFDSALAPDKEALLPGGKASLANYTSYSLGVNGIMIDLAGPHGELSLDDFVFRMGNSDDPDSWVTAPPATRITVWAGEGASGSDRVELQWTTGVKNQWLKVTLLANADTGLDVPDVFYFGNAVGESGNSATDARVNTTDQLGPRNNATSNAPITNRFDYNRDGRVNSGDELLARNNPTGAGNALRLIDLGAPILVTAASSATSAGSPIASALALSTITTLDPAAHAAPLRRAEAHIEPAVTRSIATAARVDAAMSLVLESESSTIEKVGQAFEATEDWLGIELP